MNKPEQWHLWRPRQECQHKRLCFCTEEPHQLLLWLWSLYQNHLQLMTDYLDDPSLLCCFQWKQLKPKHHNPKPFYFSQHKNRDQIETQVKKLFNLWVSYGKFSSWVTWTKQSWKKRRMVAGTVTNVCWNFWVTTFFTMFSTLGQTLA